MEKVLEKMLNSVLVIPSQKDLISRLTSLCENYAKTINRHKVEDCVSAFICGMTNTTLRSYIIKQYSEQFSENVKLAPVVYKILSEYVVHMLIVDPDEQYDDTDRMIYSLIVRNMMVFRKNSYNQLYTPEFIVSLYPFSDSYREGKSHIEDCSEKQITPDIFVSENFDDMGLTLEDLFNEIKQLAQRAAKLEYQELINGIKSKGIEDPFVLAYYAADILAINPEWKYVDANPVKTLVDILPASRKKMKLENIKLKLKDSEWYTTYDVQSKSSLLLNYIEGSNMINEIGELQLSDLEFAIYMYYEFFLEELITD
ncbi:hypothetical protein EZS27_018791 [termite gut metagenome]|uniref:Uncharacterized protein n=1 Tax=termite gut metagenome TaxID=433724 RepID=A0A5J4RGG8_9ZZZZ